MPMTELLTIIEILLLAAATSVVAWYWVESEFFRPIHEPISLWIYGLPGPVAAWAYEGFICRYCSGQWIAWILMSLLTEVQPWESFDALLLGVIINGIHVGIDQQRTRSITYTIKRKDADA